MISWSKSIKWIVGLFTIAGVYLFGRSNATSANTKEHLEEKLSNVNTGHTIKEAVRDADDDDAVELVTSFMRDDENNN